MFLPVHVPSMNQKFVSPCVEYHVKNHKISKVFTSVVTWLHKIFIVIMKCILLKDCPSCSVQVLRIKFLYSTLTWFPAHIEIDFCFLSSWMEYEISSEVFLLPCTQPNLRLLLRQTECCCFVCGTSSFQVKSTFML